MCFFMEDDDDAYDTTVDPNDPTSDRKYTGGKRWHCHGHHTWIIPQKPLLLVLALSIFFIIVGLVFIAIGAGIVSVAMKVIGGLLLAFGLIGLLVCLVVCLHAFFFYGLRDQSTQTTEMAVMGDITPDTPGYSSIGRPSALKSPDSTLKRNGTLGVKKVTMAPEVGPYGDGVQPTNGNLQQSAVTSTPVTSAPPLHRLPSTGSAGSRNNTMPRTMYVDGSTVGTGGIKITPLDPNQPLPSPGSSISGGQYYSTGGGASSVTGSLDNYAYPKNLHHSFDASSTGSQYSTLRSIPVTHLESSSQRSMNQRHGSYKEDVQYATINKSANKPGTMAVHVEHVPAHQHPPRVASPSQGLMQHVHQAQSSSSVSSAQKSQTMTNDDSYNMDYDNTVERTPMLPPQQNKANLSYHEKQMQFQHQNRHQQHQQQQQDLHAPRQINAYSLQRQYAPNPMILQQGQNDQQMQQYKMHYEQEKKQQQQQQQQQQQLQYQTQYSKSSAASSARNSMVDDVFEPQPLVYPSARRPMTFEQVSSSKISVYDNVLANNLREKDELES